VTSIQARVLHRLERRPDGAAVAFYGPDGGHEWWSLERFCAGAWRVAETLEAHGLRQADVCVLVLPGQQAPALALLATLLLGAVPLLVAPPALTGSLLDLPRILARTARRTRARLIVLGPGMDALDGDLARVPARRLVLDLHDADPASTPAPRAPRRSPGPGDLAALQLTSGTTGFPRVCVWDHARVLAALDGMAAAMALHAADRCFNWTPLYHDMGLVNNFLLCLTHGVPLALLDPAEFVKRPALWIRGLSDTHATLGWSPNFGLALAAQRARESELEGVRLDRVRALWNAAERIHATTMRQFHERFAPLGLCAAALKTNYGCAENVGGATFSPASGDFVVEHVDAQALAERGVARPAAAGAAAAVEIVGVGRPCPGIAVEILSPTGRALPDGRVGEIALRTPSRLLGYRGDARATRRALHGDLLRTGDLGYRRGPELFWVGRVKERITLRGKKFDPSDLERVLLGVRGLREGCFAAFGVDDARQGTERAVVVAEVRSAPGRPLAEIAAEVREQVLLRLGLTLSDVVLVRPRTLAKTSSGKRRHRHFRRMYAEGGFTPYLAADPA